MGIGKVGDMDVVAHAGAVGSVVVITKYFDEVAPARSHVEDERDEMGLGRMGLAASNAVGAFGSSSHVEVAQRSVTEAVNAVEPGEHVLDEELGLAVGVGG